MIAIDTNVLVYSLDDKEPVKRDKARILLRQLRQAPAQGRLLWQVGGEFLRQLRTWQDQGQISKINSLRYFRLYRRHFPLVLPRDSVLDRALDLADRYSLSHWDSMLIAACVDAGIDTLYTEDMGSPSQYDTVRLLNPFV